MVEQVMKVQVHLLHQSQPIVTENVINTYVKEGLFCVYSNFEVQKYPIEHIFRVVESYT